MNENATGGNGDGSDNEQRQFALRKIYIKDFSFEAPGVPTIFSEALDDLDIQLNLKNSHTMLSDDEYEVVLHISVHAKADRHTVFLIEMDQAGIFTISGYSPDELRKLAGTYCPTTLFPYAREMISSAVTKGGFPPLTLQPINFDAVFRTSLRGNRAGLMLS